ncbi:MAG TPA: protein-disulfide reductase DsbD domain-containing protein, partial [Pyrinomonadaceae bacterium]|nr:protein-disulfide reductase DsbD domain-containing protein [Pyrinomonadaceae bacterium]
MENNSVRVIYYPLSIIHFSLFFRLCGLIFLFSVFAFSQNPTKWSLESDAKGKTLKTKENFKAAVKAEIEGDWHLYALEQPAGGPIATTIKVTEAKPFQINGEISAPKPITEFDPNFQIDTKFYKKQAEFIIPLQATSETSADDLALNV